MTWKQTGLLSAREWHTQWSWAGWRDQDRTYSRVRGGGCTHGTKGDTLRGWRRKGSGAEVDHVRDVVRWSRSVRRQVFRHSCRLRAVIIRYLSDKKAGVNDEIRFSEYHDEPCTEPGRKRDKRVHKDKCEDSIIQEEFVLSCLSTPSKTKTRVRVRTKIQEFVGTAKNGLRSRGCSNEKQNTWTDEMLLERSTTLKVWQECMLTMGHRDVHLEWRKGWSL